MPEWKNRLHSIMQKQGGEEGPENEQARQTRQRIDAYLRDVVVPAFQKIKHELYKYDRRAVIDDSGDKDEVSILVYKNGQEEFVYTVRCRAYYKRKFGFPVLKDDEEQPQTLQVEVTLRSGSQRKKDMDHFSEEAIIDDFLHEYEKWGKF